MSNGISPYEQLVMATQDVYANNWPTYAQGGTPYELTDHKPAPYEEQVARFAQMVREADHIVVGGASGLSAAGGGDFYYEDTPSFREHFGRFAEKYGIHSAFEGSFRRWDIPEERWGFLATFLHTTQTAPLRKPYRDLDAILADKDFFVVTTNQDTQFTKIYPKEQVAQIQGDHRYLQCSHICSDDIWDALGPAQEMVDAMGDGTEVPSELIPRCPHCGAEAFPWVRGYGNFLQGTRYHEEYDKVSDYLARVSKGRVLFVELGVGRMTPMFIQEPFWNLVAGWPSARYVSVNDRTAFLPKGIEDQGMAIKGDIARVLADVRHVLEHGAGGQG